MNPNQDFDSITDSVLFNVFESLVALDENLNLKPALAVSWENPSPEIWRFHLRQDVRFHDGSPLTAEIVRESLLHVKNSRYETSNILSPVQEIKVVDEKTVDLITETPSALLSKLPFVYIFRKNTGTEPPFWGTGPYTITEWHPNGNVRLNRFEQYWGTRSEFAEARFFVIPDTNKRLEMLKQGSADLAYYYPMEASNKPTPGIKVVRHTGITVYYLGFDLRDPQHPFSDKRVREAIHLALDRSRIISNALFGNGAIPTQPVAPFVFGYDPAIPPSALNQKQARQLMTEAGYSKGFSVSLDLNESRSDVGKLIREDLAKINIDVQLNPQGRNEVYQLVESGKSRFFLVGWDCSSGDASEFYEFNLHTRDGLFGHGNYGGYSNPEMDQICEKHYYIVDELERRSLLQKAAKLAMRDLPVVPVFIEDDLYGIRDTISFIARADGQVRIADVHRAK